ncbi:DUF6798 domain-containing protein [Bradyrhizobium iriomotense]|uniref:DUF6798 domain-containing protein n=1 Tax=Bradyrhizobium iriomotense TaxID=441950 RepID=A0ABQ6B4K1_9BRAD|nr:DUF6798 domain-containing protein [Bradyrhizobium iriomotense]GLR89332.1 hypothetical protein GCM10007857_60450 [Bradyrhizobium iriomotense]
MTETSLTMPVDRREGATSLPAPFVDTLTIAVAGSLLSILTSGYVFGVENNIFHLPIVAGLYNEPQYQDDAFIQSMRYFASGIWIVLADTQKYFGHTEQIFFALNFLSRLLSVLGFLCCASLLGITDRRDRIVFTLLICSMPLLFGYIPAGTGGLFINCFTHSEIANGTILLGVYFAARARFTAATVALGVTFFVNAFMAIWLAPLLALIAIGLLIKKETSLGTVCLRTAIGVVIIAPIMFPVLHAILSNPELGKSLGVDYAAYLHEYFAGHSLIDSISMSGILQMVAVTTLGAVALYWFGPTARELQIAYLGAIALYLIGVVVPSISTSPFILNIQLLRSSTIIYLLAGLAIAALATCWLRRDSSGLFLPGCAIVLSLYLGDAAFLIAISIILASTRFEAATSAAPPNRRKLGYAMLALAGGVMFPVCAWQYFIFNRSNSEATQEWADVANWARMSTPASATFIVPLTPNREAKPSPSIRDIALSRAGNFEFISHRRVWVDYKRGAAAMWTPSYYVVWHQRMTETAAANDHASRLAYAAGKGIGYVVEICDTLPPQDAGDVSFRTAHLCVSPVKRQAAGL